MIKENRMNLTRTAAVVCACCVLWSSTAFAGPGTTACQFLKINPSAGASGMAGVSTALEEAPFALYANPAGLARLDTQAFGATYLRYFADINYGFLSYAAPLKKAGAIGFSYTYLMVGDIEKRDADETRQGTFSAQDTALTASYARENAAPSVLEGLDLGASVKIISSRIDQTVATSAACDVGASYRPVDNVTAALAVQNIGYGIRFREETDPLPLCLKAGVAWRVNPKLTFASDIDEYLIDNKAYAALGAQYQPVPQLTLRAGYRFGYHTESLGSQAGLGIGFGVCIWSAGLDYAFVPFGDLGDTHRVSFLIHF